MLAPVPLQVVPDRTLPSSADVVVVGGGIVGAFTALELAEKGMSVALIEKGEIAHEQSGRNLGWVRMTGRAPAEIALMAAALRNWEALNDRTGRETGYVRCGIAYADKSAQEAHSRRSWSTQPGADAFQPMEISDLRSLFPGCNFPSAGGLYGPHDGRAEPQLVAPAVAEAARARGAKIFTNCAVRGFEVTDGGISKAITSKGAINTRAVVVAGGIWSTLLLRRFGVSFPQLEVMATVMCTQPLDGPDVSFGTGDFAFRRRLDGGYNVGSFKTRVQIGPDTIRYGLKYLKAAGTQKIQYVPSRRFFADLLRGASWELQKPGPFETKRPEVLPWFDQQHVLRQVAGYFPFLSRARVSRSWVGLLDVTPDTLPVIDAIEDLPGLFLASGFSGHGFGLAPAAGQLIAEMVAGEALTVDPVPFAFSRFFPSKRGNGPGPRFNEKQNN